MESTLPPDPYKALGVAKGADATVIKSTYRKLVLKCHPDKVTDESLKKQKQEEFHKIQQAYELIGDEEKRAKYDAEVKLEQLRRENLARKGGVPNVEVRTGRYEVRTQAPAGATFTTTTPHRYEEHKPASRSYDDRGRERYYEERSRKYDTYEAYPKHGSSSRPSRSEKEPPVRASTTTTTRATADRTRSDYKKSRDKEERKERSRRFVSVESDSEPDDKVRYEADYRRRDEDARKREEEEQARRQAAEARRKAEESRRSYDDPRYDRERKTSDLTNNAVHYIHRSKVEIEPRPSASRTTSSRDVRPEYYESRSRRERPEPVRRSSARPKDRPSSSGRERDRKGIEIVDWEDDRAPRIPSFKHSSSSPAELHTMRATPQRSYTESSRDHRRTETSPTPVFRRTETAPAVPSSRRKEATVPRPSGLRESTTPHESGSSSPETYPTVPPAQSSSTKKYYYPTPGGGVRLTPEDVGVANGHRTVLHEPGRHRARSPSPLTRPPMGPNRPTEASATYTTAVPKTSAAPPPLGRSATMNVSPVRGSEDRGRRLYGEIGSDFLRRENARRQTSFSPEQVSYTHKIGPEDIRWSAHRGRDTLERDREYAKPTLGRHATYVY